MSSSACNDEMIISAHAATAVTITSLKENMTMLAGNHPVIAKKIQAMIVGIDNCVVGDFIAIDERLADGNITIVILFSFQTQAAGICNYRLVVYRRQESRLLQIIDWCRNCIDWCLGW